jgi:predicted nucleic acid-binding protein
VVKIPAVLDSTCLIGLENIDRLDLLPALLHSAYAPPAVAEEFGGKPDWLVIAAPADGTLVASLEMMVDKGEAAAIALAAEMGARIILDDRKARGVALRLGVPVTGTVGLLLKAKHAGLIPAIGPLLDAFAACGFHIGRELRSEALRLADE